MGEKEGGGEKRKMKGEERVEGKGEEKKRRAKRGEGKEKIEERERSINNSSL